MLSYTVFVIVAVCVCRLNKLFIYTFHLIPHCFFLCRSWLTLFRLWILYTCLLLCCCFFFLQFLALGFFPMHSNDPAKNTRRKKIWLRQLLFCWYFLFLISKWKITFYSTLCFALIWAIYQKNAFFTAVKTMKIDGNRNFNTHFLKYFFEKEEKNNHITKINKLADNIIV